MFHLKRMQEDKDGKGGEDSGAGAVDGVAAQVEAVVAVCAEVAGAEYVDHDDEGEERGGAHD